MQQRGSGQPISVQICLLHTAKRQWPASQRTLAVFVRLLCAGWTKAGIKCFPFLWLAYKFSLSLPKRVYCTVQVRIPCTAQCRLGFLQRTASKRSLKVSQKSLCTFLFMKTTKSEFEQDVVWPQAHNNLQGTKPCPAGPFYLCSHRCPHAQVCYLQFMNLT